MKNMERRTLRSPLTVSVRQAVRRGLIGRINDSRLTPNNAGPVFVGETIEQRYLTRMSPASSAFIEVINPFELTGDFQINIGVIPTVDEYAYKCLMSGPDFRVSLRGSASSGCRSIELRTPDSVATTGYDAIRLAELSTIKIKRVTNGALNTKYQIFINDILSREWNAQVVPISVTYLGKNNSGGGAADHSNDIICDVKVWDGGDAHTGSLILDMPIDQVYGDYSDIVLNKSAGLIALPEVAPTNPQGWTKNGEWWQPANTVNSGLYYEGFINSLHKAHIVTVEIKDRTQGHLNALNSNMQSMDMRHNGKFTVYFNPGDNPNFNIYGKGSFNGLVKFEVHEVVGPVGVSSGISETDSRLYTLNAHRRAWVSEPHYELESALSINEPSSWRQVVEASTPDMIEKSRRLYKLVSEMQSGDLGMVSSYLYGVDSNVFKTNQYEFTSLAENIFNRSLLQTRSSGFTGLVEEFTVRELLDVPQKRHFSTIEVSAENHITLNKTVVLKGDFELSWRSNIPSAGGYIFSKKDSENGSDRVVLSSSDNKRIYGLGFAGVETGLAATDELVDFKITRNDGLVKLFADGQEKVSVESSEEFQLNAIGVKYAGVTSIPHFDGVIADVLLTTPDGTLLDMPIDDSMGNTFGHFIDNKAIEEVGEAVDLLQGEYVDAAGNFRHDYFDFQPTQGTYKGFRLSHLFGTHKAWKIEFEVVAAPPSGLSLNVYKPDDTLISEFNSRRYDLGQHTVYAYSGAGVKRVYFRSPEQDAYVRVANVRIVPVQEDAIFGRAEQFQQRHVELYQTVNGQEWQGEELIEFRTGWQGSAVAEGEITVDQVGSTATFEHTNSSAENRTEIVSKNELAPKLTYLASVRALELSGDVQLVAGYKDAGIGRNLRRGYNYAVLKNDSGLQSAGLRIAPGSRIKFTELSFRRYLKTTSSSK